MDIVGPAVERRKEEKRERQYPGGSRGYPEQGGSVGPGGPDRGQRRTGGQDAVPEKPFPRQNRAADEDEQGGDEERQQIPEESGRRGQDLPQPTRRPGGKQDRQGGVHADPKAVPGSIGEQPAFPQPPQGQEQGR